MPLTVPGTPIWELHGDDVDGMGTLNASLVNGQLLASWFNLGSSGNSAAQGGAAIYDPTLLKAALNGHDVVVFDQDVNHFSLTGSDASLAFIHQTGIFDIVLVFRPDFHGFVYTMANSNTGTVKGFGLDLSTTNTLNFFICSGAAVNVNFTATQIWTQGVWWIARIHGDGTKVRISQDGGTEQASSDLANALGTGNMASDARLGANHIGTPFYAGMTVAFLGIWNAELSSPQWTTLLADLQAYYSI